MDYLYLLQTLRESAPGIINLFFYVISEAAVSVLIAVPAIIYWCCDKQFGSFIFLNSVGSNMITQFVKNVACVYRPWILDSRLYIEPHAAKTATGYSFPSGHTTMGASIYQSIATWKKKIWIVILCLVLTLLTAVSRNWLGAHTLADVGVAILIAEIVIFANIFVMRWISMHPEKDILLAVIVFAIEVAAMIFIQFKHYPVDFGLDGKILVSPKEMIADCYSSFGIVTGFLLGWILERRVIKFDEGGTTKQKILRAILGITGFLVLYVLILPLICKPMPLYLRKFVKMFVIYFYILGGFPAIVKKLHK